MFIQLLHLAVLQSRYRIIAKSQRQYFLAVPSKFYYYFRLLCVTRKRSRLVPESFEI